MKFTAPEIFAGFLVLENESCATATCYTDPADKAFTVMWGNNEEQATFDLDVVPNVFATTFTITDREGQEYSFTPYKEVRLNEIPEIR